MKLKGMLFGLALSVCVPLDAQAAANCKLIKLAEASVTMTGLSPLITVKINGADAKMTADSGAFFSLLTPQAAARLGLHVGAPPPWIDSVEGLGGREGIGVATAKQFTFAGIEFHNAAFIIAAPQLAGQTDGLIGNNLLSYADVEFDLPNGEIRLFKPQGCPSNASLAYWATTGAYSTVAIEPITPPQFKIVANVKVNGREMRALLDSGAGLSFITRRGATEAGVPVNGAAVQAGGVGGGIGRHEFDTWIAPFASLQIGDEEIKNSHPMVGAADLEGAELLIGADFLLSHRVYVANSEHRIFFTYTGGPVFSLDHAPIAQQGALDQLQAASAVNVATSAPIPGAPTDQPTDADGFSRRGAAFAARHDWDHAIADFTRASALAPTDPKPLVERARARMADHQPGPALSDLDQALKLKPDHAEALLLRGDLRLGSDEDANADLEAAARADPGLSLDVAYIYTRADRFEPAVAVLDRWIAANPKDIQLPKALNNRCWVRALWGRDLDQGLADCNVALRLTPHISAILDSRGLVNLRLGKLADSIADYDESLRLQSRNAWSLYGRGLARRRKGDTAGGDADVAAAAAIDPQLSDKAKKLGLTP